MTVVEAYVGRKKINPPYEPSQLQSLTSELLSEGTAQNTTGNVFKPKVSPLSTWQFTHIMGALLFILDNL